MADRNWEKELAAIDKRLDSLPNETAPVAPGPTSNGPPARSAPAPSRALPAAPSAPAASRRHWTAVAGLLLRLGVAVALLAAIIVWPYETRCGGWLAGYLATIGVTMLMALWTAVAAWRHRGALSHVAALSVLLAAGVYGAREVLPRVGYALPDPTHPTIWVCQ